jgi:hypothetical protein
MSINLDVDLFSVSKATDGPDMSRENAMGGGYYTKPGSGKDKRTLQSVKTHFYVGTEVDQARWAGPGMSLTLCTVLLS